MAGQAYEKAKKRAAARRRRNRRLMVLAGIVLLFLLMIYKLFFAGPSVHLTGKSEITVEVFNVYEEPGVSASLRGKNISDQIKVRGSVNTELTGDYELTYYVEGDNGKEYSAVRTVHVVDTEAPVLTLKDEGSTVYASSMASYQDPGYTATDNFDGNLETEVDIVTEPIDDQTFRAILRVWDQAGNMTQAERTVTIKDVFAPELVMAGDAEMTILQGEAFTDPGVTAVDDLDGDLTSQIEITGYVDPYLAGEYTLNYTVTDAAGNTATAARNVTVEAHESYDGDSVIYLTFDDGPSTKVTEEVLDVLKANDVQATFFIIGYEEESIPILKRMIEEGHTIGVHSLTHDYAEDYAADENYLSGVETMIERVKEDLGYDVYCTRFPGGGSNTISKNYNEGIMTRLAAEIQEMGLQYYDWNVDSTDASGNNRPVETLVANVTGGLKQGRNNIILCHDTNAKETTAQALQQIIDYGKANGYTFSAIKEDTPAVHHTINN